MLLCGFKLCMSLAFSVCSPSGIKCGIKCGIKWKGRDLDNPVDLVATRPVKGFTAEDKKHQRDGTGKVGTKKRQQHVLSKAGVDPTRLSGIRQCESDPPVCNGFCPTIIRHLKKGSSKLILKKKPTLDLFLW